MLTSIAYKSLSFPCRQKYASGKFSSLYINTCIAKKKEHSYPDRSLDLLLNRLLLACLSLSESLLDPERPLCLGPWRRGGDPRWPGGDPRWPGGEPRLPDRPPRRTAAAGRLRSTERARTSLLSADRDLLVCLLRFLDSRFRLRDLDRDRRLLFDSMAIFWISYYWVLLVPPVAYIGAFCACVGKSILCQ